MTIKTDILIIGGGSIGLNCAYYLLKSGRKVTIVDSKEIAQGSSSGNAGHIVPSSYRSSCRAGNHWHRDEMDA